MITTLTTKLILTILLTNFVGDQIIQPKKILEAKDDNILIIIMHVVIWSLPILIFCWYYIAIFQEWDILLWWMWCFAFHICIDYLTGAIIKSSIKNKEYYKAVIYIHGQQFLVITFMLITFYYRIMQ